MPARFPSSPPAADRPDRQRRVALAGLAAALGSAALGVRAQAPAFPSRPLRIVIPYPAGGAGDIVGRLVGGKVGALLGQPVVIDNRGGGAQVIASELAAHAPPDGYTLLLASTTHAINPALRKLPYDTLADFTPVSLWASSPLVFVAHPSLGVGSIAELIAKAKAKPGTINYGSSGPGTGGHLSVELLKSLADVDFVHVPYKGAAPALTDLVAGQVQLVCTSPLPAMPHVKAGRIKALALTGAKRSPLWPDLPTVAESGYPSYQSTLWYALVGPAKLPPAIVAALREATVRALAAPDVLESLHGQGAEAVGSTPAELDRFLREEIDRWGKLIAARHITSTE